MGMMCPCQWRNNEMKMKKIYIAGHRGMVGSAIKRQLMMNSSVELIFRSSHELDLMNQDAVQNFFIYRKDR